MDQNTLRTRPLRLALLLAGASLALGACSEDEDTRIEIQEQRAVVDIEANLQTHLDGLAGAAAFLAESGVACDVFVATETVSGGGTGDAPVVEPGVEPDGTCSNLDMREAADGMIAILRDKIFVEANIASRDAKSIRYRLDPANVCGTDEFGDPDYGCIDMLETMPLAIEVSQQVEGDLDLALIAVDTRVASVELYRSHLAVEFDLGATLDAYESLARRQNADVSFDGDVTGRVRMELVRHAEADYEIGVGLASAVKIDIAIPDTTSRISLDLARSFPMLSGRVDGTAKALEVGIEIGALDARVPGDFFGSAETSCSFDPVTGGSACTSSSTSLPGDLDLHLAGFTGRLVLDALAETVALTGLGMGEDTTWLAIDGSRVVELDLNAESGRVFDATVTRGEDGARVAVEPGLALVARLTMSNLAEVFGEWAIDETVSLTLADAPVVELGDALEVIAGTLTMASDSRTVTVSAGECVLIDAEASASHPLDGMSAGACPEPSETTPTVP